MRCEHERLVRRLEDRLAHPHPHRRYLRPIEELWRRQSLVQWALGRHLNWFITPHARSSTQALAR
jgi:hypothetical protein